MIKVNLLPLELQRKVSVGVNLYYLFVLPVILIFLLIPVYTSKVQELKKINSEIEELTIKIDKYKGLQEQLKKTEEDINSIKTKIAFIEEKRKRQLFWNKTLDKITSIIPANIWLDSLGLSADGGINMHGNTFSFQDVADFIKILSKSENFYNVKLLSNTKSFGSETEPERVKFSITCNYKETEEKK